MVLEEATEAESPLRPLAGIAAGKPATVLESSQAFELLDTASDEDCPSEDPGGVKPVAWADMAPTAPARGEGAPPAALARGRLLPSLRPSGMLPRSLPLLRLNHDGHEVPDVLANNVSLVKALQTALAVALTLSLAIPGRSMKVTVGKHWLPGSVGSSLWP